MDEMIRIRQNCESFGMKGDEPSCFFITGFLNGFFSAVRNQHVKETKCIAVGTLLRVGIQVTATRTL